MSKLNQRVELIANGLISVVAVLIISVFIQRYFFTPPLPVPPQRLKPIIGEKLDKPEIDFSQHPKTLILALQTTCHFCNESAPFYKRLLESTRDKNIKIVAAFPSSVEEGTAHLKELGLANIEVKESSLDSLKVGGTPTLILTNEKGEITKTWVGKLTVEKETEVINDLNS